MSNINRESNVRNLQDKLCKMFLSIFDILAFLSNAFTIISANYFLGLELVFSHRRLNCMEIVGTLFA